MTQPGRNAPCPCGSGRKYKTCCQRVHDEEQTARLRLRAVEGAVVPRLFEYAIEKFGREYAEAAWDEFLGWPDVPIEPAESEEATTTFEPFWVFSFVPDPEADDLPGHWPTVPLALDYLAHEGNTLTGLQHTFIIQACRSPASFFAVEGVEPGHALSLRDMFTGWRVRVLEQTASRGLQVGDVTYARVVTCEGTSILLGACPWVLPASWQLTIIDARRHWRPRRAFRRADLDEYDMELRDLYFEIVDAEQHPVPPLLHNTDGDILELWTLTYSLGVPAHDAITRLLPLAQLGETTYVDDEERNADGTWRAATLRWMRADDRRQPDGPSTVMATLRVDRDQLTVDVNSAARRTRIERQIGRRLGGDATQSSADIVDPFDLAKMAQDAPGPAARAPRDAELIQLEAEIAQQQWVRWLDTRVPALRNRTPRQAARTAAGRERLEALLADFAQQPGGAAAADVPALRRALGLDAKP